MDARLRGPDREPDKDQSRQRQKNRDTDLDHAEFWSVCAFYTPKQNTSGRRTTNRVSTESLSLEDYDCLVPWCRVRRSAAIDAWLTA